MNGMTAAQIFFSRPACRVRVLISAGTEQPKPMNSGTNDLPPRPSKRSG